MSLSFANPAAFWLLLLLPVFVVLKVAGDARAVRAAGRMVSPRLLDSLLVRGSRGRRWAVFALELLALVCFTAALARPRCGTVSEEAPGTGRSLIIAIDTSRSMNANDVLPSRLERAQLAAEDLVKKLRRERIGLMPFAGSAFMYAPVTPDTDAILESIQSLDTEIIPQGGSNLAKAIDLAVETFRKSDLSGQQALILFSDGEELQGEALAAARRARDARVSIVCVAVGTLAGGLIPDNTVSGGYFRDRDNRIVQTKLQRDVLVRIADLTGGLYLTLEGQGINDARLDVILQKLQRSAMKSKTIETAVDRYRWPLAAGLLALVASFLTGIVRRYRIPPPAVPAALLLTAALLAGPAPAEAREDSGAAPDPAREGDPWAFYAEGDWRNAVFNFGRLAGTARDEADFDRIQLGRGVAAFKAAVSSPEKFDGGMMEQAVEAFGKALASRDLDVREKAHYNLANAIFERAKAAERERAAAEQKAKSKKAKKQHAVSLKYLDGVIRQMENSLEHYQEALTYNKDHAGARKNHEAVAELVKKLREIRKEKASQEGQGKGQGKGEGKGQGEGQGQGSGGGQGSGEGEDEGKGGGEGEEEGPGESGQEEKGKGKGGEEGPGKGKNGEGEGEGGGDESNKEFDGRAGADGDTESGGSGEQEGGEGEDSGEPGSDAGSSGEIGRNNAIQNLKNLSQELKNRPRSRAAQERRPAKDW